MDREREYWKVFCVVCGEPLDSNGECPNDCTENELYDFALGYYFGDELGYGEQE